MKSISHFTFTMFYFIFQYREYYKLYLHYMKIGYFEMQKMDNERKNRSCQTWKKYEWSFRRSVKLFYMRQLLNLWHFYPPFIMHTEQAKQNAFSYKQSLAHKIWCNELKFYPCFLLRWKLAWIVHQFWILISEAKFFWVINLCVHQNLLWHYKLILIKVLLLCCIIN